MGRNDKTVSLSWTGPVEDKTEKTEADLDLDLQKEERSELTAKLRAKRLARGDDTGTGPAEDGD